MKYSFRNAVLSDLEFCRTIHHIGLRPYVESLWGWDSTFQDKRFSEKFNFNKIRIIQVNDTDVGYLETSLETGVLKIENLILASDIQGLGLGSKVITDLIESHKNKVTSLSLNVLKNNPSQKLYARLGFKIAKDKDDLLSMELCF